MGRSHHPTESEQLTAELDHPDANSIWARAVETFGDEAKARHWMNAPRDIFGGRSARQLVETLWTYLPVFGVLLVLAPLIVWDTIRFTHRLVGPLVRFRQTTQAIARGEAVRPIKLRDGDYLTEMRDDFNKMLEELQKHGVPVIKPTDPAQEQDSQRKTA